MNTSEAELALVARDQRGVGARERDVGAGSAEQGRGRESSQYIEGRGQEAGVVQRSSVVELDGKPHLADGEARRDGADALGAHAGADGDGGRGQAESVGPAADVAGGIVVRCAKGDSSADSAVERRKSQGVVHDKVGGPEASGGVVADDADGQGADDRGQ